MGELNTGREKFAVRVDLGPGDGKIVGAGPITGSITSVRIKHDGQEVYHQCVFIVQRLQRPDAREQGSGVYDQALYGQDSSHCPDDTVFIAWPDQR